MGWKSVYCTCALVWVPKATVNLGEETEKWRGFHWSVAQKHSGDKPQCRIFAAVSVVEVWMRESRNEIYTHDMVNWTSFWQPLSWMCIQVGWAALILGRRTRQTDRRVSGKKIPGPSPFTMVCLLPGPARSLLVPIQLEIPWIQYYLHLAINQCGYVLCLHNKPQISNIRSRWIMATILNKFLRGLLSWRFLLPRSSYICRWPFLPVFLKLICHSHSHMFEFNLVLLPLSSCQRKS